VFIHKLRKIGGNLLFTIPRQTARQLGWSAGAVVKITVVQGNILTVERMEIHGTLSDRLQTNPNGGHTRATTPTKKHH